jgi:hypothetical protein
VIGFVPEISWRDEAADESFTVPSAVAATARR